jgi:hypothetical protein
VVHCGNGISGQQRAKNLPYRGQFFVIQIGQYGYKKNPKFYADFKNVHSPSDKMYPKIFLAKK